MNISQIITTEEAKTGFYPTPPNIAGKMLASIDWALIETILEPSAGKGNLIDYAIRNYNSQCNKYRRHTLDVDCIEIDPYLKQILKYNFSKEKEHELYDKISEIEDRKRYDSNLGKCIDLSATDNKELKRLKVEKDVISDADVHIIHDDFLTFHGRKHYDLILMNPPFSDGDKHLLKAIELQNEGGAIICLLNAETLLNPYTNSRKVLKRELDNLEAKVTFVKNGFTQAERKTNVSVAIVKINIPRRIHKSTIYERMEKAEKQQEFNCEAKDLVAGDYLEQAVQHFNIEVAASLELIREYEALRPYMATSIQEGKKEFNADSILTLTVGKESNYSQRIDVNGYMRKVRLKYWTALFENKQFTGKLTSNLREMYCKTVDKMADYDFTMYNIKSVMAEMNAGLIDGVKETIISLFDKLTAEHSWYPETKSNIHYYNGWKTNKAHKVGKKVIIPTCGMFSNYSWNKQTFDVSTAYGVISDIEKAFNYLDGGITQDIDLKARLKTAESEGRTRNIECKYFKIDLFKKGTTHIKFTNMDLVEKLNIYAAKNKSWLPPNYGRTTYANMEDDEKQVVDNFQGEKEYSRVMSMARYFLSEPTRSLTMINGG